MRVLDSARKEESISRRPRLRNLGGLVGHVKGACPEKASPRCHVFLRQGPGCWCSRVSPSSELTAPLVVLGNHTQCRGFEPAAVRAAASRGSASPPALPPESTTVPALCFYKAPARPRRCGMRKGSMAKSVGSTRRAFYRALRLSSCK